MQLVTCRGVSRALRILYAVTGSPVRQDKGRPAEPFLVAAFPKMLEDRATVVPDRLTHTHAPSGSATAHSAGFERQVREHERIPLSPQARPMHCHGCTPSCLPATFEAIIEMVSPFAVELLLPSFLNGLAVKALSSPQTIPQTA